MSKLIKSNQVKIGDEKLIIPSAITIPTEDYLGMHPTGVPSRVSGGHSSEDEETGHFEEMDWSNAHYAGQQEEMFDLSPEAQVERMLESAQRDADGILENARESAVAIEAEALDQVKTLYERTYQEAYAAGKEAGYTEGRVETQEALEEALQLKNQWHQRLEALLPELESEAVRLVLSCLEKVLGEVAATPDYVASLLQVGFDSIAYAESVEVRVCERDFDYALTLREKALAMTDSIDDIQFKVDYALEPGQVVIETSRGSVDVSLQVQVEKIRQLFESMLESEAYA